MGRSILFAPVLVMALGCIGAVDMGATAAEPVKVFRVAIEAGSDSVEIPASALAPGGAGPGASRPWGGEIEFYIDGVRVSVNSLDQPLGSRILQLEEGLHLFRFAVALHAGAPLALAQVREPSVAVEEDDCVGQFEVHGPLVLRPRLRFVLQRAATGKIADSLACFLTPIGNR
jgi:hypothetical protein